MGFYEILDRVVDLLRRRGRGRFQPSSTSGGRCLPGDLRAEIITAQRLAVDEQDAVLVWVGEAGTPPAPQADAPSPQGEPTAAHRAVCDLVDSTVLASQLDPEELREVVRAYQDTVPR